MYVRTIRYVMCSLCAGYMCMLCMYVCYVCMRVYVGVLPYVCYDLCVRVYVKYLCMDDSVFFLSLYFMGVCMLCMCVMYVCVERVQACM